MDTFGIVLIVLVVSLIGWIPISVFLDGIANVISAIKGNNTVGNNLNEMAANEEVNDNKEDEE